MSNPETNAGEAAEQLPSNTQLLYGFMLNAFEISGTLHRSYASVKYQGETTVNFYKQEDTYSVAVDCPEYTYTCVMGTDTLGNPRLWSPKVTDKRTKQISEVIPNETDEYAGILLYLATA